MNNIKVCLDRVSYSSKPNNAGIGQISNRIANQQKHINSDNIRGFVGDVGLDGHTFTPATFKGKDRKKENFEQMQLFVLDFDNDTPDKQVSFDSVKQRADTYNLPILFAYESFSSKDKDRFRVVMLNDTPITKARDAEVVMNALVTIFPECDKSSREINRMYFGGNKNELLYFDDNHPKVNIVSAVTGMTCYLKEKHGKNYTRKVAEFVRDNRLATNDRGMPDVSITYHPSQEGKNAEFDGATNNEKNSPNSTILNNISIIEGFGENFSKKYYVIKYDDDTKTSAKNKTKKNHADFRSTDIPQFRSVCQLLREFEDGTQRLHHNELFGLATNLTKVETGGKLFLETFKRNAYADGRMEKYGYWVHQIKKYFCGYHPQSCSNFCRYCSSCPHGTNLLSTSKLKYHQMERIAGYHEPLFTLDEAEKDYRRLFYKAVEDPRKLWFILKAQTAIGKTHIYLEFIRNTSLRVLIVVPTNILKNEIRKRAKHMGTEIIESPSLREIKDELPDDVWERIEYLYASGKSVIPYLKKLIRQDHPECAALFKQYLNELDEFNKFEGHAITTHKRFLPMDVSKYDLVIIDEDILLGSIIQNKIDISISELKRLKKRTAPGSAVGKKVKNVLKHIEAEGKTSDFFDLPAIEYDNADDGITMGVDISSFCSATRFLYRRASDKENKLSEDCITFIQPVEFKSDTKYIMVSATVNETVCEYFFGKDNMEFYECKKAKLMGTLYQDHRRSMSRADIRKDPSIIKQIKTWSGFKHTISFKEFMKYYVGDLQFGNCAGCNYMKNENIDVMGTPHIPEWIYKLFAYMMGCEFDAEANIMPGLTVEHNGWRFRFTTYVDEVLRTIQFYIIESQLEQAVGRARLLREDCTVNLFSNFPLCQANMRILNYDNLADDNGAKDGEGKGLC